MRPSHHPHKGPRVYNVLFPIWMLVWLPSFLWLLLIPANYAIDTLVLRLGIRRLCPRHTDVIGPASWRICLRGFVADFVGALLLLVASISLDAMGQALPLLEDAGYALTMDHFTHPLALVTVLLAIGVAGLCIYVLDRRLLVRRFGLTADEAHRVSLLLAIVTAPYLFLIPTTLIYRS